MPTNREIPSDSLLISRQSMTVGQPGMSASYSSSAGTGMPHNQTRLYTAPSSYGGSSEKVLQVYSFNYR